MFVLLNMEATCMEYSEESENYTIGVAENLLIPKK